MTQCVLHGPASCLLVGSSQQMTDVQGPPGAAFIFSILSLQAYFPDLMECESGQDLTAVPTLVIWVGIARSRHLDPSSSSEWTQSLSSNRASARRLPGSSVPLQVLKASDGTMQNHIPACPAGLGSWTSPDILHLIPACPLRGQVWGSNGKSQNLALNFFQVGYSCFL